MKTTMKRLTCFLITLAAACSCTQALANAVVTPATQPEWSIGAFTLKEPNLKLGATKAYRPWFENGAWQGDIIEYDVDANGNRATDVLVGDNPASDGTNNWSARFEFANQEATVTDYWKAAGGRKIITHDGTGQVAFLWGTITDTQKIQLDPITHTAGLLTSYDSPVLNYVRGDRSQESPVGLYRIRYNLLGDPGKIQPLYVGAPTQILPFSGHAQYKTDNAGRAGRVLQAANDGMVHVFDAATGIEVYAYVPSPLLLNLKKLTKLNYEHTWFADGELASGDAKVGGAWKTLVAAGFGAGAKGLFALDVTNPNLSSETSIAAADTKILWEQTNDALGYIHGKPAIAPLSNGTWYVITGNGYASTDGTAVLYMAPVNGGTPVTIATDNTPGNGLSAPALVDTNGDSDVDVAYAGDLLGNLWKFDLNAPGTAAQLLFAAGASKPITTAPDAAIHPNGGYLVYFGTGSLLSESDGKDTALQTVYAIWDYPNRGIGPNPTTVTDSTVSYDADGDGTPETHSVLLTQTLSEGVHTYTDAFGATVGTSVRLATGYTPNWSFNKGWKIDLPNSGERVIKDVQLRANRLQFVTDAPTTNTDNPTGISWLVELHWLSGGDAGKVFFDLNGDGDLNTLDKVEVTVGDPLIAPIGLNLGQGNRSKPTFGRVANGVDTIFINGVDLQVFTCEGICAGGLQGGHMDVDTDLELGGGTDSHQHEFDDKYDITYIDYFDMLGGDQVDSAGLDVNAQFVAVLANADLSSGGELTIGTKEWDVVDYQEMIQQRLLNYDGTDASTLVDETGASLVFTLQEIVDAAGTLRTSFKDRAIISGGLLGSNTGCVKGNIGWAETGRWRNGALTLHLIQLDTIGNGNAANNSWLAQTPGDLVDGMVGGGIIANPDNTAGFLYESTVFWHWSGDVAKEVLGDGGMCYGEDGWYDAMRVEGGGITQAEFDALFPNYSQQQDYIDNLVNQLTSFTCEKGTGSDCDGEDGYKLVAEELKDLVGNVDDFLWLRPYLEGSDSGDLGVSSGGKVAEEVTGVGDSENDTIYTGTPTGRISWIDLKL